jgi:gas vesicle protein
MGQQNIFGEFPAPEVEYQLKGEGSITASALNKADPELQKEVMQVWFYSHFEDPVHSCPYNSDEGGYQFIYGGPYEADEELQNEFSGIVPDEVIEELAEELQNDCPEWSGDSSVPPDDFSEWDYEPSVELPKHLQTFSSSISNVTALLAVEVPPAQQRHFRGMLYVSVIMAMEAYLLDNFLSCLNSDKAAFRKYIETTEYFRKQKIPLNTIFKESEGIDKRGRAYLTKMLWHRLSEVARLYRNTLGVQFPDDMKELIDAVQIRHDFVHRNGRTPDGKEISLTSEQVTEVVKLVRNLIEGIEAQQKELSEKAKANNDDAQPPENTVNLDLPQTPKKK